MKVAHEVIIDAKNSHLIIDGDVFPFYVMPDPEIELMGDERPGVVHVGIIAENIRHITSDGQHQSIVRAPQEVELRWARARAKEVVYLGLQDIIERLDRSENE